MIKTQLEDVARIIASQPVPEPIVVHIPYAPVTPEVKEEKKVEEAKEEAKAKEMEDQELPDSQTNACCYCV